MTDTRLHPALLRRAYAMGYFPMPHGDPEEIAWFHPDPRAILPLDGFHVSRSLARTLRRGRFSVTRDRAFRDVMRGCADRAETWINDEFLEAYGALHDEGDAHSVEVWLDGTLVGGVYGVSLGGAFFAESMFHRATDASKVALHHLTGHLRDRGFALLETQFLTPHLESLGVIEIDALDYMRRLEAALRLKRQF